MTPLVGGIPNSILPGVLKATTPGPDLDEVGGTQAQALAAFGGTQSLHPVSDRVIRGLSPAEVGELRGPVAALSETWARWFLLASTRNLQGPASPEKLRAQEGSLGTEVSGLLAAGCASAAYPWLTCSRLLSEPPAPSDDVSPVHFRTGQEVHLQEKPWWW